ncbi:MAG: DUF2249 domain-containing protein [Verrucomicrobia bacterium]|nr:DUF2249 domain-containing protein [Verrucomicrobiota bacterium]
MRKRLAAVALIFHVAFAHSSFAQTELYVQYKGEEQTLYYMTDKDPYVLIDGKRKRGDWNESGMRSGEGFVTTKVLRLEKSDKGSGKKRSDGDILFKYEIELTADRDLNYCFGVLIYLVNGNPTTFYKSIGKLRQGSPKKIKFETTEIVSQVGNFHIFSEGQEILATGVEEGKAPLGTFLAAVDRLKPGQELMLIAPFKPIPVFALLGHRGFKHESKPLDKGGWQITFRPCGKEI